jgi:L-fuculose-phosphate aldolase
MWEFEKKIVLEAKKHISEKGLVLGNMGNVSLRIADTDGKKLVAITPSGRYCDSLNLDDIVIVDFEGKCVEGKFKPSVETMLHIGIYRVREEMNAIIHAHPVFSSVMAVIGQGIPSILDDQIICLGGEIKVAAYAKSGSTEMVKNVVSALGAKNAVILANHGALSAGRDIREAITNCEILEKTAKVYVYASNLGKINTVPLSSISESTENTKL